MLSKGGERIFFIRHLEFCWTVANLFVISFYVLLYAFVNIIPYTSWLTSGCPCFCPFDPRGSVKLEIVVTVNILNCHSHQHTNLLLHSKKQKFKQRTPIKCPKLFFFVLTHNLQHVETFSYLELVTSRGIFFVALHHSLQERPSQQRIRTRHGSLPCARCLHCTLVYTCSLRTGPRPMCALTCLSDKNITPTSFVFDS